MVCSPSFFHSLDCLKVDAPPKSQYKETVLTKISAHYEHLLWEMAASNSKMKYLHVSLSGLRGRQYPALANIITTINVQKSRIHLKMLA